MTAPFRIIVVDDERLSRVTTAQQLRRRGYEAEAVENAFAALKRLEAERWDVILTDLRMPGMTGLEFLTKAREMRPQVEVILMTAYATIETAVEAMRAGAADYLVKPFRFDELDLRLRKILGFAKARNDLERLQSLLGDGDHRYGLVGRSPAMQEVIHRIEIFADHDAPVLITGETGTGKEVVAKALHENGHRRNRPFVAIACGAIPRDLAESELFGHEKGSFTGALQRRLGSFERARGGTVLLDDVDDLPPDIQVKLLRVLQEGTIVRVGGAEEIEVDVRIVATTKVDLATAVEEGEFRDDLFYRLRGLEIRLPRLAERGDDVVVLAKHFLEIVAAREGADPRKVVALSVETAKILRDYHWPGNVRELRRAMESAFILSRGDEIRPEHMPAFLPFRNGKQREGMFTLHIDNLERLPFHDLLDSFEDELIKWALTRSAGQQKRAAELLGIPRTTLQSRMNRTRGG